MAIGKPNRVFVWFGILAAATVLAVFWAARPTPDRLRLTVSFIGYTNDAAGFKTAILQVSNASPFTVIRGATPFVQYDLIQAPIAYQPRSAAVLDSGQAEMFMTLAIADRARWRLVVVAERNKLGLVRESKFRAIIRALGLWLRAHHLGGWAVDQNTRLEFASEWVGQ